MPASNDSAVLSMMNQSVGKRSPESSSSRPISALLIGWSTAKAMAPAMSSRASENRTPSKPRTVYAKAAIVRTVKRMMTRTSANDIDSPDFSCECGYEPRTRRRATPNPSGLRLKEQCSPRIVRGRAFAGSG